MNQSEQRSRIMTVANIRDPEGKDHFEVMFLESARFYRVSKANVKSGVILATLRGAMATKHPVKVVLTTVNGDVIEDVLIDQTSATSQDL